MLKTCFVFLLGMLCIGTQGWANCPIADEIARTKGLSAVISAYQDCALYHNDDDTQLYLARVYATGQENIKKNYRRALLFYHLGAETGNATAMVELAKLLTDLDDNDSTREEIIVYLDKIRSQLKNVYNSSFSGELLHPYALLILANEPPESKWFYTTQTKSDPRTAQLLKNYAITPDKKKEVIKSATLWKQRKMLDMARKVFSVSEFNEFYRTLDPKTGLPDSFARAQAVENLKSRIERLPK